MDLIRILYLAHLCKFFGCQRNSPTTLSLPTSSTNSTTTLAHVTPHSVEEKLFKLFCIWFARFSAYRPLRKTHRPKKNDMHKCLLTRTDVNTHTRTQTLATQFGCCWYLHKLNHKAKSHTDYNIQIQFLVISLTFIRSIEFTILLRFFHRNSFEKPYWFLHYGAPTWTTVR